MTVGNACLLKAHLRKHPEFTGEGGAENTWNTGDVLHLHPPHSDAPALLVQAFKSLTSITGASLTSEKHESYTPQFTGPQDLLQILKLFCNYGGGDVWRFLTIKGWKSGKGNTKLQVINELII